MKKLTDEEIQRIIYFAKKFFPHLRADYGFMCVLAILENRRTK